MNISLPTGLTRHLTLLRTFAVLSALIIALIGVILATNLQSVSESIALRQATTLALRQADTLLHGGLLSQSTNATLSPATIRALASYTDEGVRSGLYVRVKIWRRDGTVLFSNDPTLIGKRFSLDDELEDVLNGRRPNFADLSSLNAAENRSERNFHRLLEVYVPIHSGQRIVGAYELYQSLDQLDEQDTEIDQAIWRGVIIGLVILYLSLFLIVRNASIRLSRQRQVLEHQARHDSLTDLPNRRLLQEQIQHLLQRRQPGHEAPGASLALLLLDLDRFKEVNDTFGHQHGDHLLQQVGARLRSTIQGVETVARLGGDEYVLLLPTTSTAQACAMAEAVVHTLEEPFIVDGYSLGLGASLGIALAPEHGHDAMTLLRRADVAMYAAKRTASGYALYTQEQDTYSPDRLVLVGELRQAIEEDHLILHYQPKMNLRTGHLDSVEALVRWQHPTRGLIPPDQFIPLAEQTGLITPLSRWVLATALHQSRRWSESGLEIQIAVNLSARLFHDEQLLATVTELLQSTAVAPQMLQVEVTESAIMLDPGHALRILTQLHQMGIQIALDDFGTGYSSLAYLKKLPVDEIKIDKSFVRDMATNTDDATIARSVIDLGHNLGLTVVAEGVEDLNVWNQLAEIGCDLAQGYYMSRPLPAAALTSWVQDRQANAA